MEIYNLGAPHASKPVDLSSIRITQNFFDNVDEPHLILTTLEEFTRMQDLFGFPAKAVRETLDASQFPNVEFYDNLLFLTINNIQHDKPDPEVLFAREINIFLGKSNVMVIYHGQFHELDYAIGRIDKSNIFRALYTFIDAVMDNSKRRITEIEQRALALENQMLRNIQVADEGGNRRPVHRDLDQYMDTLVSMRKELQFLKAYIDPTQDIIEILEADESDLIPEQYNRFFLKLSLKADRLTTYLINLRDTISQVQATWQAQVDLAFNKTAKFFTVVTSIFLPLTLVAGWFGMNFTYMPELDHPYGYPGVIVFSVLLVTLSLWWFRRNRYI